MYFLNSILNNIDEALIVTDKSGKILFFNGVALDMSKTLFNKSLEAGENILNFRSYSEQERVHDTVVVVQMEKRSDTTFAEYTSVNGTTAYLESSYIPVFNAKGELTHIHIFTRDITPQKIFEQKLTAQATSISNLIENANAIIIGVDTRGYVTDWNDYCSKVTGFEKNEVFAEKFTDVLLKGENYFDDFLSEVLYHKSISNFEIPVRTKSGKKAIFLLSGTHRTSSAGDVTGVIFVGQDVTELTQYRRSLEKKVEERTRELQEALKKEKEVVNMKSRFISIASHEFRTPLSSIEVAANYIKTKKGYTNKELHEKLSTIEHQVKHMTYLLDDVLTYGKSEAGKIQLVLSPIQLEPFIIKILEDVENVTKNTHVISKKFIDVPDCFTTDEKLFRNILINLLTNAIKFSPGKPCVYLSLECARDQLVMIVRDEGIGIPKEEMEKIFEAFIRGTGASSIQGTGLGLSIAKKAVELLEGTILVESELGTGTVFTVKIPMR